LNQPVAVLERKPASYHSFGKLDSIRKTGKTHRVKTKLSSKGQIVIPLEIRKRLGLPVGAFMDCQLDQNRIILSPCESNPKATLVTDAPYIALEAPVGAPEMSPESVKDILSEL
jgi:AbrB family looped-hinge helix DNA binding protein